MINKETTPLPPLVGDASVPVGQLTVNEAAQVLGVDSFTMFHLIQRGKVNPSRSPSGEITLAQCELAKLTEKGQ